MGSGRAFELWGYRGLYVGAVLLIVLILMLPFGPSAGRLPGPDLILALTIAWAMRRSDHLPILLVAAAMLLADFLLMRPPGLMAALTVIAVEVIRAREGQWRDLPLVLEWLIGAALIVAIVAANALLLAVFFVPQPTLGHTLIRLILTIGAYPITLFAALYIFGVARASGREGEFGARP
ncbi:MAG: rod shape-determining protein MreD [Pseudomonadota bacterium]